MNNVCASTLKHKHYSSRSVLRCTCNLEEVHDISETLFTHTSLPRTYRPKHPVKWRRYTTANIGPFAHSIWCDRFSAFVYAERARVVHGSAELDRGGCEGGATYSFRSFRRAANQPTDRPTEVMSGANCGGCCGTSVRAAALGGAAGGGSGQAGVARSGWQTDRGARAPKTRLLVPRHSKRRYPRARRPGSSGVTWADGRTR